MNRKGLIVVIVVLALILVAGLVFVFVSSNPTSPSVDAPQLSQTDGPAPSGDPVDTPATSGDAAQQENQSGETVADPVQDDPDQSSTEGKTEEKETVPPATNPDGSEDTATIPDLPEGIEVPESDEVTYEDYQAMSGEEQMAFYDSFPSTEAFFEWYNAAEQAYRDNMIEVDNDTEIDLGEIIGNSGN